MSLLQTLEKETVDDWVDIKNVRYPFEPEKPLTDWLILKNPKFWIFYQPENEIGCGFKFVSVERITYSTHDENWAQDEQVYNSWYGYAFFDGIRHMYLSDDGYLNYPDIDMQIEILTELKKLDEKYCRD